VGKTARKFLFGFAESKTVKETNSIGRKSKVEIIVTT